LEPPPAGLEARRGFAAEIVVTIQDRRCDELTRSVAPQTHSVARRRQPMIRCNGLESRALSGSTEETIMADDKTLRAPQDSSRIAMGEDYEVVYWTHKFGVGRDRLQQAVDAVGNGATADEQYLKS
jgi:hypothetical protein